MLHSVPSVHPLLLSALVGACLGPLSSSPIALEPHRPTPSLGLATRKDPRSKSVKVPPAQPLPTYATVVNLHADELVALSENEPSAQGFSLLLRDRVTGHATTIAPRLLALLRDLTRERAPTRIEVVSAYRSWKLNEMLRKKGRRVSPHSQHVLGNAIDFRIEGLSAKELADAVEATRWKGGLAFYPGDHDRFIHADVGPNRRWRGR